MGLDPRFIIASDLESIFVDKTTGEPLSAGILTFYSDVNRTQKKPIYELTGSPPNYSYTALPNPITLSTAGTLQDEDGNNIIAYYYPYQGTPDDDTGIVENYYVVCTDSGLNPEFTRQAWPNFTSLSTEVEDFYNFIPNGQFVTHNNVPATDTTTAGQLTLATTDIAQGGWTFELPSGFEGKYFVSFYRFPIEVAGIQDFPRYGVQYICTNAASDSYQTLRVKFKNVNTFASPNLSDPQEYTFFCNAQTRDENTYTCKLVINRYYGAGGSPTNQTIVGTFSVTPTFNSVSITFDFGNNDGMTLGANDDDFVSLDIQMPQSTANILFTDFALVFGDVTITAFPVETTAEMIAGSIAGWIQTPTPTGSDFYLPMVQSPAGMVPDYSQIGTFVPKASLYGFSGSVSTLGNELLADGSVYETSAYSPLGIPYSRLQNVIFNNSINFPIYGTGSTWVSTYISIANTSMIRIQTNTESAAQTATADGSSATGFTFSTVKLAKELTNQFCYSFSSTQFYLQFNSIGTVTAPNAGTTGFTVFTELNNDFTYAAFIITATAATGMASQYFTFNDGTTAWYMWFKVDGSGSDPAPGGYTSAGVINLLSTWGISEVSQVVRESLCGTQSSTVLVTAVPTAGSWFTYYTSTGQQCVVWFSVDNAGTAPVVAGAKIIKVSIASTATTDQIATAIQYAINSQYFAVPDIQGLFVRGYDPNRNWDLDATVRLSLISGYYGNVLGTIEESSNLAHLHSATLSGTATSTSNFIQSSGTNIYTAGSLGGAATVNSNVTVSGNTGYTGISESRSSNFNAVWAIKY